MHKNDQLLQKYAYYAQKLSKQFRYSSLRVEQLTPKEKRNKAAPATLCVAYQHTLS